MDRNTITGLVLIFGLIILWQTFFPPVSPENLVQEVATDLPITNNEEIPAPLDVPVIPSRSLDVSSKDIVLENEVIKVTLSNLGARIKHIQLKNFKKSPSDTSALVDLMGDIDNRFNLNIPTSSGILVNTENALFQTSVIGSDKVVFDLINNDERFISLSYTLDPNDYRIQLNAVLFDELPNQQKVSIQWLNHLEKIEINENYERNFSSVYYKTDGEDPNSLSLTKSDESNLNGKKIKWISHSNQFFNTSLIADDYFSSGKIKIERLPDDDKNLKRVETELNVDAKSFLNEGFNLTIYSGPNEFERLYELGESMQEIIPFGWSFFGTINRWIIRPMFNFLSSFIDNMGWGILVLTFLVKMLLFPLTYRMLYSQSKMGALKPKLEQLKSKFKADPQQQQVETMKIYREHGVNPLGGCLPMLAQMPIWFALYRFFPAAIEFRQAQFLWADDLSSFDVIAQLPFEIPLGFGSHLSLFTLLWAVSTLIFTYYNTKDMDMSANPAMKYLQYLMPILFLGFFNSYASGLTAYLFFSNVINIGQTIITKKFFIDQEKIKSSLEAYKANPKKKSKFQERLEEAMKEQQKKQAQRNSKK
jgi:YidC/Oxa1 family membrane protein insertase